MVSTSTLWGLGVGGLFRFRQPSPSDRSIARAPGAPRINLPAPVPLRVQGIEEEAGNVQADEP